MRFQDRTDAGRRLASALMRFRDSNPVVLALPRGGVVVGYEVARALDAPLDVLVVRKIGAPGQPELAAGAVAEGGEVLMNERVDEMLGLSEDDIRALAARELPEIERRVQRFRGGQGPVDVAGKTVILVDDGLATGTTARAAVRALRRRNPAKIVLAVPVGAPESVRDFESLVDEVVCLSQPYDFFAVGQFYHNFEQTTDDEVVELLERARRERGARASAARAQAPGAPK